ncbi:hypothetical protein ONZ45_g17334 [Pleurotus djamor]|nr:hypothetical protein ONZ45_g17334 [Pleurotus djamor]
MQTSAGGILIVEVVKVTETLTQTVLATVTVTFLFNARQGSYRNAYFLNHIQHPFSNFPFFYISVLNSTRASCLPNIVLDFHQSKQCTLIVTSVPPIDDTHRLIQFYIPFLPYNITRAAGHCLARLPQGQSQHAGPSKCHRRICLSRCLPPLRLNPLLQKTVEPDEFPLERCRKGQMSASSIREREAEKSFEPIEFLHFFAATTTTSPDPSVIFDEDEFDDDFKTPPPTSPTSVQAQHGSLLSIMEPENKGNGTPHPAPHASRSSIVKRGFDFMNFGKTSGPVKPPVDTNVTRTSGSAKDGSPLPGSAGTQRTLHSSIQSGYEVLVSILPGFRP